MPDEKPKRKTHTSTAVKQRYNQKAYGTVKVQIPKELAAAFKARCEERGISQASVVKAAVERFLAE